MKQLVPVILLLVLFSSATTPTPEIISENEKEWESLFDGKTLNGWHRFNRKGIKSV